MTFVYEEEAKRLHVWLRAFFMGPTGSGKSRAALELAALLFGGELPITLINTERGRGRLYADRFKYQLIDMSGDGGGEIDHSPGAFVKAIDMAEDRNRGGVLVVDSASHEWVGTNGVLQQADRFGDWKTVRPKHNEFVDRLMAFEGHVIVCVRAKMKYEVGEEDVPGRSKPRQVVRMLGVGPIQSDDMQYEFNLVARFDQETHDATFSGHVDPLDGQVSQMVQPDVATVAETLSKWLSEGDAPEPPEAATAEDVAALVELLKAEGHGDEKIESAFAVARRENRGELSPAYVLDQTMKAQAREQERAAKKKAAEDAAEKPEEKKPEPAAT